MFITARNREPKEGKPQSTGGLHSKFKVAAFSNGPLPLRGPTNSQGIIPAKYRRRTRKKEETPSSDKD